MTKQHSHDSTIDGAHSHEHVHDQVSRRSFLSVIPGSLLAMRAFAQGADSPAERFRRMSEQAERTGLAEPFKGITAAGEPTAGLFPIHSTGVSTAPVRNAAVAFLNSLTAEQRAKTMFPIDDPEWRKWMNQHFYVRQGVSFKEMTNTQREAAFGLMRASLSARGMELTRNIMRLNETLAELTNDHEFMGEWMYFITIMGKPSASEPWGWQFDGHHAIINYFVLGDQIVMTPNFVGSEPVLATSGKYKGTVILQEEQAQGLAMAQALTEAQRKKAVLDFSKTGNNNLTEAFKDNIVLDYAGVRVSELSARQNRQMMELVNLFISNMDAGHARVKMDEVKRHLDKTCFAWIGGTEAESTFYYRIHSPVVLVEFDHQRPANLSRFSADPKQPTRQHIHVVVRTPNGNDYGKDLLRQHYLAHQHKS
ncbi:MAG TPA: DUF3500 domain-containing protein [Blastocatellia bacterium]|nr:DUF3500 domain-containing protein [Blastocatellia bacterium]